MSSSKWRGLFGVFLELESTARCRRRPLISPCAKLKRAIDDAIINDMDEPAIAALLFEPLLDDPDPLAFYDLVIVRAAHTLIASLLPENHCAQPIEWSFGILDFKWKPNKRLPIASDAKSVTAPAIIWNYFCYVSNHVAAKRFSCRKPRNALTYFESHNFSLAPVYHCAQSLHCSRSVRDLRAML
jgi:hypothetical protein